MTFQWKTKLEDGNMKLGVKEIAIIVVLILFFISGFFVSRHFSNKAKDGLKRELRVERIKNDSIRKISEGHYSKLVADTLTKRQLREKVKELEFKIKNPTEVGQITLSFDKTKTEGVAVKKDSLIKITDYYPNEKSPFITYNAVINTFDYSTRGSFYIRNLELQTAKGINRDGTTSFEIKLPQYINVSSLDIQSQNTFQPRRSNFGYLLGGQAVMDYNTNEIHAGVNFGVRYKKTYLTIGTTTNNTIQTGLTFEF